MMNSVLDVINLQFPGWNVRYLCLEIRRLIPARDVDLRFICIQAIEIQEWINHP